MLAAAPMILPLQIIKNGKNSNQVQLALINKKAFSKAEKEFVCKRKLKGKKKGLLALKICMQSLMNAIQASSYKQFYNELKRKGCVNFPSRMVHRAKSLKLYSNPFVKPLKPIKTPINLKEKEKPIFRRR